MKLRIRGNSLRLRLTRTEVECIGRGETVREMIDFSPASRLEYVLEASASRETRALFESGTVRVQVPGDVLGEWASSLRVSFEADQDIGGGRSLRLLIEKDFACLKPRGAQPEDENDLFPNPNEAHGTCGGA